MTAELHYLFVPMAKVTGPLPNRIREHRKAAGLTLEALGERVGLGYAMIGAMETGRRTVSLGHLRSLARALGVYPADLLSAEDNPFGAGIGDRAHFEQYRRLDARGRQAVAQVTEQQLGWVRQPTDPDAVNEGDLKRA